MIEDISKNLPGDAQDAGLRLLWQREAVGPAGPGSVTLLNRLRQALFYWPYNASLGEVRDKAMELLKEGRIESESL